MKKNKKKLKILLITFLSILIAGALVIAYFLFLSPSKQLPSPLANQAQSNRYQIAQVAIFNEKYSINYNGTYKFSRVNYVDFSNLSNEEIDLILNYYNCADTMSLLYKFRKEKLAEVETHKETLVIYDSRFQFNYGIQPNLLGSIYGNDDLSVLYDKSFNKICTVSLTRLSQKELESTSDNQTSTYHGDEMFLTLSKSIEINEEALNFDIVYVYKIIK